MLINNMGPGVLVVTMLTALVLLSIPVIAETDGWTNARCIDSTHLLLYDDLNFGSGRIMRPNATVDCAPYECNNLTEMCNRPYQMTAVQADFSLFFFVFMFVSGVAALFFGVAKQKKHVILTIWSTIMFTIMSLQSVALDAVFTGTFFAGFTPMLIGLSMLLAVVSLLATFIGMLSIVKKNTDTKNKIGARFA